MSSLHPSELDSAATDSVASSPRSEHHGSHDPRVRFMCSFGGKILPRPHDNLLRYVGGDTRIVAVHRSTTFSTLLTKLSKLSGIPNLSVKYQLPNEDLDALISVTTDEDVENMMDEYERLLHNLNPRSARLRLFLFSAGEDSNSRASSISSLLDGSANREHWFLDAINAGAGSRLERGRSEASSIVSEVPDYLFGLDNSDEAAMPQLPRDHSRLRNRPVLHDNVSASDPGSPAPVVSSPYCSTSSAAPIPDLPPVKTKPDNPELVIHPKQVSVEGFNEPIETPPMKQPSGNMGNPVVHYIPNTHYSSPPMQQQMPVYYVSSPIQQGNYPVQHVQMRQPYVQHQQQYPVSTGQMPVGYHQQLPGMGQVYGGMTTRPVTTMDPYEGGRLVPDGVTQQVYYGVRNTSGGPVMVPGGYGAVVKPGGEDIPRTVSDASIARVFQSS